MREDGPDPSSCILCSNWGTCPYHGSKSGNK